MAIYPIAIYKLRYNWVKKKLMKKNMANTAEEVWQLLGELAEAQKETDRQLQQLI